MISRRKWKQRKPIKRSRKCRIKRTASKTIKKDTWTLRKADRLFSEEIRSRDQHCLFPGCFRTQIQCSHYIGRATKSTRFDPDNCISLCYFHHYGDKRYGFEYQKQVKGETKRDGTIQEHDGDYTAFMRRLLGLRFAALMERSKTTVKPRAAIDQFKEAYEKRHNKAIL